MTLPIACPVCGEIHPGAGLSAPGWLTEHVDLTARQLEHWRNQGLFHVRGSGSGYRFPWAALLPQVEWLRRVSVGRYGPLVGQRAKDGALDYWDGRAGVDLIGRTGYAFRVGRQPWEAWDAVSWDRFEGTREAFLVAAVPAADWMPTR